MEGYPDTIDITVGPGPGSGPCPVTPTGPAPTTWANELRGAASAAGDEHLWVGGLGEDGVLVVDGDAVGAGGTIETKLGWWRLSPGDLSIAGRRLDGVAPPLAANVPDGYRTSGFQASGVTFPTEGCWEITGTVGEHTLTTVVYVLRG